MGTVIFNKLLLHTAFCCMACDGEIAPEEIDIIKSMCKQTPTLQNIDLDIEIDRFISEINEDSKRFFKEFIQTVKDKSPDLTEQEEFDLIYVAISVIKANKKIEYSEIKFFKTIRYCLKVNDDAIIAHFSETVDEIEWFLGEDIKTNISLEEISQQYFDIICFDALKII
jgi:uncharacterized tellurite resistance protein B-like protein